MPHFLGYLELENELSSYSHVGMVQPITSHNPSLHHDTESILLIMEHRGSGFANALKPNLKENDGLIPIVRFSGVVGRHAFLLCNSIPGCH